MFFYVLLKQYKTWSQQAFGERKEEYLKDKINKLAMNSKNKNIKDLYRRINELKKWC
jgi:hypothetical protein